MEYKITVHENKEEYIRVTILETTFTLIKDDNTWTVGDYDECPVSASTESRVLKQLKAFNII